MLDSGILYIRFCHCKHRVTDDNLHKTNDISYTYGLLISLFNFVKLYDNFTIDDRACLILYLFYSYFDILAVMCLCV